MSGSNSELEKGIDRIAKVAFLGVELAAMVKKYFGAEEIDPLLDGDIALRDKAIELLTCSRGPR